MTTRQISDQIMEIYGFEVSEAMVTSVTNKILPEIEEWQKRPLSAVYPIVYIDKIFVTLTDDDTAKLEIKIFTGESTEKWLKKLNARSRSRTGVTSNNMNPVRTMRFERHNRISQGHKITVKYAFSLTV